MNYQEIEKQLFNYFLDKNKSEGFTFSLRKRSSQHAEMNYFIGTEKSKYISTTLWDIPCSYPGASIDLLNFMVIFLKDSYRFEFKYFMGNEENLDLQNKTNLLLFDSLRKVDKYTSSELNGGQRKIKVWRKSLSYIKNNYEG